MKKIIAILLSAFLFVGTIGSQPANATICALTGSGTLESPWLIATAIDIASVGVGGGCATTTAVSQHYRLTSDITLTGSLTALRLEATGGNIVAEFDGAGHSISGLHISIDSTDPQALFAVATNASIHDLKIRGTSIDGQDYVAAVVGEATNTELRRISVTMTGPIKGNHYVGGLVGRAVGGLVEDSTFRSTYFGVGVTGVSNVGGAIGYAEDTPISRVGVHSKVSVSSGGGGVIGAFKANVAPTFSELYYLGNLQSDTFVGGLVGELYATSQFPATFSSSVVRGGVKTTDSTATYRPQAFVGRVNANVTNVHYSHGYSTARYQYHTSIDAIDVTPQLGSAFTAEWIYVEAVGDSRMIQLSSSEIQIVTQVGASLDAQDPWPVLSRPAGVMVHPENHWVNDSNSVNPWNDGRIMPTGIYNLGFFGDVVEQCSQGYFSVTGGVPCLPARAGHYVSLVGQTTDTVCPIGAFQPNEGSVNCDPAPPGNYVQQTGQSGYLPCPAGQYQEFSGRSNCNPARAGRYTNDPGMWQDLRCALGTYQPDTGMTTCILSPAGSYVGISGATEPTVCPLGTFQPDLGMGACEPAPAGSFVSQTGQTEHTLCLAGTYKASTGSAQCDPARPGRFAPIPGLTADVPCDLGTYQPSIGTITCLQAPPGSYVAITGATAPTPCAPGSYSFAAAFTCYPIGGGGGGGGGGGPAPVVAVPVVSPSLDVQLVKVTPGQTVTFKGENLDKIKSVIIAGKESIFSVKGGELTVTIPAVLDAGNKDLILKSETASVTVKDAIVVSATPVPVVKPVIAPVVTFKKVGSKVTVYVTSKTPVSLTLGKKVLAKSLAGTRVRYIVTLPKGKSVLSARAAGKVIKSATYVIAK